MDIEVVRGWVVAKILGEHNYNSIMTNITASIINESTIKSDK